MAYIGVQPTDTYLSIASQQITGNGGATYTLDYSVSDEESVAVFVNNVRQNVSSYTVSSNQLTLGGTISASDSCWVLFLGRTVGTKTPAVGSVTNDMLAGSIANSKLANSSITLNGSAVSLGGSASVGITEADQWRLTTSFSGSADPIASNLERVDTNGFSVFGTGMTESSGVFTFPSTGYWWVFASYTFDENGGGNDNEITGEIQFSSDGGSGWGKSLYTNGMLFNTPSNGTVTYTGDFIFDITNTSTHKVRFSVTGNGTGNQVIGNTSSNQTWFTFVRLGDT